MSSPLDLRDVLLEAVADVRVVFRDVMMELTAPVVNQELIKAWAMMPPELKDRLAKERPEEYKQLMDYLQGVNDDG